ncbi:hypothetical protein A584_26248 [Pseudomonas syringae pv. theae ICMP 3923]|nr:hypothetical protein [Pseudomonas syringae]EPM66304.1 hypothetical protein A584_26248 [Pseudomonas syringae pv. theae ICMP 3923]KPZ32976.1 hypothetical protein AN901_203145 [Pseudomonas syringae pv. theae]MBL3873349.1 hypothetical protein [Pseudomonas syringae pv. theae]
MKLIFAMLLMFSGYAFASCNSINDHDQRAYCSAKQDGGSCNSINDRDQRAYCAAKQGGGSCNSINDHDLRAQCESGKR